MFSFVWVPELFPYLSHESSHLTSSQQDSLQTDSLYAIQEAVYPQTELNTCSKSKSMLYYDIRSVDQFVLVSGTHLGSTTKHLLPWNCCGFDVGRPLWQEDRSVVCSCCWALPAQSFSGLSPSSQSQSYITTDGQSASLSRCQTPIWDPQQTSLIFLIIFRELLVSWCGAPSLTRSRARSLQLLLGLASSVFLRPESGGVMTIILLSQIWDSSNLEGQVPIFISPQDQASLVIPQDTG
jgi:hypothetical protein